MAKPRDEKRDGRSDGFMPRMDFYPQDFLADRRVQSMSTEEQGAYFRLLCFQWMDGPLPGDARRLARMTGLSPRKFKTAWEVIGDCFETLEDGTVVNPRLWRERQLAEERRRTNQENGSKGGRPKGKRGGIDGEATGNPEQSEGEPNVNPGVNPTGTETEANQKAVTRHPSESPTGSPPNPPAVAEGEREEGSGSASARNPEPDTGPPDGAPPATGRPRQDAATATAPPKKVAEGPAPSAARQVLVRVWRDVKGRGRESPSRPGRSWARFDRSLREHLVAKGVTSEDGGPRLVDAMRAYLACDEDWCASHPLTLFLRHFDRWWQGNPSGRKVGGMTDVAAEAMRLLNQQEDRPNEPRIVDVECESSPVETPGVADRGAEPLPGAVLDPVDRGRPRDRGGGAAQRRAVGAG